MNQTLCISKPLTGKSEVGFVLPDLRGGGAERVMLCVAREFMQMGIPSRMLLAQERGALLDTARHWGVPVTNFSTSRLRNTLRPLRRWVNSQKPAGLIASMWPLTSLSVCAAAGLRVPVLTVDHATLSAQYQGRGALHRMALRASVRASYPFATQNVSVSKGAARDLETLGRLNEGAVQVIHNPVAAPRNAGAKAGWLRTTTHKILAVGSLRWQKDFPTLLRAFAHARNNGLDAELVILGEGPDRPRLEALIQKLGINDCARLLGYARNPGAYFEAADLFVLSSRSEGFGNVLVEALACGLPVIATDCPNGPREILQDGALGTLVPVGDTAALSQAMLSAFATPHDADLGRQRALDFHPTKAAMQYADLLFAQSPF